MPRSGVKVRAVEKNSLAEEIGLAPGDEILSVNGHPIPDELALKFHLTESATLEVRKAAGEERSYRLELSEGLGLGLTVEDFRTRTCNNACLFCFIDQLPQGVRNTLKVKDDDYRLSFLHGNYITLTNLPERELDRILELRLSPLYVSVHATDPALRTYMLGRRKTDDLDRKMRKLIDGGIRLHTQIVLMPGINDGSHLERTVADLYGYYPGVESVAVVPLGLSDRGKPKDLYTPVTPGFCRDTISLLKPWQEKFRKEAGLTFAYLADEFYLQGGIPLPEAEYYDEYAQIEDGVGMVRRFLDEFDRQLARRQKPRPYLRGTLATGRLFYPFLKTSVDRLNSRLRSRLQVREVENRFMGRNITVAGLLAGQDILSALQNVDLGDFVIIPEEALSRIDYVMLDDVSLDSLSRAIGRPVYPSGRTAHDFFELLCSTIPPPL